MEFTIGELAAIVGGKFSANAGSRVISGVSSILEASATELTFFGNPRYLPLLRTSRAAAALVPLGFTEPIAPTPIEVENPSLAFAQILDRFIPPRQAPVPGVHPSAVVAADAEISPMAAIQAQAVVESGAKIGPGTFIGAFCYVGAKATVGADCHLHPRVTLAEGTQLGARVIIQSGAAIGSDGFGYEKVSGRHVKIPQTGFVQIDDDVEIGANTTVDRARFGRTWIQTGAKIDNLVQIAHNVVIGPHCLVISQTGISGSSKLGAHVTIAGQVGLVGHIEIGEGAIVAAQSGVSKSVPPGEMWLGSPAVQMSEQKERFAHISRLGKLFARVKQLEERLRQLAAPEET